MDSDQTSLDMLSHFDRPKTLSPDEISQLHSQPPALPGVCLPRIVEAPPDPPAEPGAAESSAEKLPRRIPQRDVRWILKWAAALAVVSIAAIQLAAFSYLCQAQHALNLAARAGASGPVNHEFA